MSADETVIVRRSALKPGESPSDWGPEGRDTTVVGNGSGGEFVLKNPMARAIFSWQDHETIVADCYINGNGVKENYQIRFPIEVFAAATGLIDMIGPGCEGMINHGTTDAVKGKFTRYFDFLSMPLTDPDHDRRTRVHFLLPQEVKSVARQFIEFGYPHMAIGGRTLVVLGPYLAE